MMNADNKNNSKKSITENERVQKEIIRQRQGAFVLVILLFAGSIVGHYFLKHHLAKHIVRRVRENYTDGGHSTAARHINRSARKRDNSEREEEL